MASHPASAMKGTFLIISSNKKLAWIFCSFRENIKLVGSKRNTSMSFLYLSTAAKKKLFEIHFFAAKHLKRSMYF
jgi:hypothetical protein